MSDWRQLKPRRSPIIEFIKVFGLIALVAAGLYFLRTFLILPNVIAGSDDLKDLAGGPKASASAAVEIVNTGGASNPASPTSIPVEEIGTQAPAMGGVVRVGAHPPAFTLLDMNGESHSILDHQGQVLLINFWTTWCPPCREEMPALQQTYEQYQDDGFVVLGVNWTAADDPDLVGPYVEELGLTFPILLDEDSAVSEGLYNLLGLPTSVFVGRDGIIREIIIGALDLETLEIKITRMLEEHL